MISSMRDKLGQFIIPPEARDAALSSISRRLSNFSQDMEDKKSLLIER